MWTTFRNRNFTLLWFAGLISYSGDWILRIALPITVYKMTGSASAISLLFIAYAIPSIVLGSVAGVFVDRWERRRLMVITNVLMGLAVLPLIAVQSSGWLWLIYLAAFIESAVGQFFGPSENAMLPLLVEEKQLGSANALNILNNNLARFVGAGIGGVIVGTLGLEGALILDALTYFAAAGLVALISVTSKPNVQEQAAHALDALKKVGQDWRIGIRFVRHEPVVRLLFLSTVLMAIGEGTIGVLFAPFVLDVLRGGEAGVGALMSAQAIGGISSGVVVAWIATRAKPSLLCGFGALTFGLIDLMIFNYSTFVEGFAIAIVLFVLVGIPAAAAMTGLQTIMQLRVPDELRGRVFGALGTTFGIFTIFGMAFAGIMSDSLGIVPVLNIQGFAYTTIGIMGLTLLHRQMAEATPVEAIGEIQTA
ncbi:MAG: MFS transporter [Anaerolineae bacterium]|nr:MFS transporter [Anaerolineae bacterium]